VGLLLSFELPVHTDRDGRPIVRFLVSRSRTYQQTLASLIHEVPQGACLGPFSNRFGPIYSFGPFSFYGADKKIL
jgi:hypothetical protein